MSQALNQLRFTRDVEERGFAGFDATGQLPIELPITPAAARRFTDKWNNHAINRSRPIRE